LQIVELGVKMTRGDQFIVRAVFGDLLIGEHQDPVGGVGGGVMTMPGG
jgi:hypothetical protein